MKFFNRAKLIPSLAASAMVAAATLAPLSGFLTPGSVYAAPPARLLASATPNSPARLTAGGTAIVNVTYKCPSTSGADTIRVKLVQRSRTTTTTGNGTSTATLICNNRLHSANVSVTSTGTRSFIKGSAVATAKLRDSSTGKTVGASATRTISIR